MNIVGLRKFIITGLRFWHEVCPVRLKAVQFWSRPTSTWYRLRNRPTVSRSVAEACQELLYLSGFYIICPMRCTANYAEVNYVNTRLSVRLEFKTCGEVARHCLTIRSKLGIWLSNQIVPHERKFRLQTMCAPLQRFVWPLDSRKFRW
jgi:hypothetical protein